MNETEQSKIISKLKNEEDLDRDDISLLLSNAPTDDDFLTLLAKFVIVED